MTSGLKKLALAAVFVVGCGNSAGATVLHGPLAFPVVVVDEDMSSVVGNGTPATGWPVLDIDIQSTCFLTDGLVQNMKMVDIEIWNADGGPIATGTRPLIDPSGDLASGSAMLFYRDFTGNTAGGSGAGGSVALTEAGPDYVGSFTTSVNGQILSGTFSTMAPNQCACLASRNGGSECSQ